MKYKIPEFPAHPAQSNNNISRQLFNNFLKINNLGRFDARNVFVNEHGQKIAFAYCPNDIFCRQFYEDLEGLVVFTGKKLLEYKRSELKVDFFPNRLSPEKTCAFTARPNWVSWE